MSAIDETNLGATLEDAVFLHAQLQNANLGARVNSFSVMLGVNPGYDGNAIVTPEDAIKRAMPYITETLGVHVIVDPAAAAYDREWGCPDGGEVGVLISGTFSDEVNRRELENQISILMAHLGQSTGTVEYHGISVDVPSTRIVNSYNGQQCMETFESAEMIENKEAGIHFVITTRGDIQDVISMLQDQMETVDPKTEYTITGYLHETADGKLIYEGTQNPAFAPDSQKYLDALDKVIKESGIEIDGVEIRDVDPIERSYESSSLLDSVEDAGDNR